MTYLHYPSGPRRATWMTAVAGQQRSVAGLEYAARVAALMLAQQPGCPGDSPARVSAEAHDR